MGTTAEIRSGYGGSAAADDDDDDDDDDDGDGDGGRGGGVGLAIMARGRHRFRLVEDLGWRCAEHNSHVVVVIYTYTTTAQTHTCMICSSLGLARDISSSETET